MWYKSRRMLRRGLTLTILAVLAVQLIGGLAFASACLQPCSDDAPGATCPPACALCTGCTHAQQAIVRQAPSAVAALLFASHVFSSPAGTVPSALAADIFHVPLPG
jgi:hypothetical protein